MVQHRIFNTKPLDVCKKCPSKNQRSQTGAGRSGQGLDFCHWSLNILIFWYRPFAKLFLPLSILSVQKKKVASSGYACARRAAAKITVASSGYFRVHAHWGGAEEEATAIFAAARLFARDPEEATFCFGSLRILSGWNLFANGRYQQINIFKDQ